MASHYVVAMFALMSSCLATAGPEPSTQCELSPVNASHPVQALMESFTVLSGCASRGTTGLPQEVHVLNLRAADPGPGQPQREHCVKHSCVSPMKASHILILQVMDRCRDNSLAQSHHLKREMASAFLWLRNDLDCGQIV
uniref:Transforming growth factor beta receptor 3 n=1 Tax=Equus asinus TaxID=9793 RepID=A0A9L0JW49_EQUAS